MIININGPDIIIGLKSQILKQRQLIIEAWRDHESVVHENYVLRCKIEELEGNKYKLRIQYCLNEYADNPLTFKQEPPEWLHKLIACGDVLPVFKSEDYWYLDVRTSSGNRLVSPGGWLIWDKGCVEIKNKMSCPNCNRPNYTCLSSGCEAVDNAIRFAKVMSRNDYNCLSLNAEVVELRAEAKQLHRLASFLQSAIKSGERWTDTCELEYRKVMGDAN